MKAHRIALLFGLSVLPALLVAACSAEVQDPAGTAVTSTTSSTTSGGGGGGFGGGGTGGTEADAGPDGNVPDVMVDCSSADDCNAFDDTCNEGICVNGSCLQQGKDFASCDDGDPCTENDACQGGVCLGGTPKFCDAADPCHVGVCNPATGGCDFVAGNEGAQCDDQNPCTYTGFCSSGVCLLGTPVDCTLFDSQCTVGVCDQVTGCYAAATNENGGCDDNQYCTINDKCVAGDCVGAANTCTAPGDVCMIGSCDEGLDQCVAVPGNDGAACDDGNLCTGNETCLNGLCQGGQPANNGVACDDANGCTSGTTCANGTCTGAASTITQCINNDSCCPANCSGVDDDCLYWASGVQKNVPTSTLVGWTQCFTDTYDGFSTSLQTINSNCDKAKLLMACYNKADPSTLVLAAMADRADVLFDCDQTADCTKQSNGVGWYWDDSWSWGFAPGGAPVNRFSCDFDQGNVIGPDQRMCWHTGGGNISSGYRCGTTISFDSSWGRVVYEAD